MATKDTVKQIGLGSSEEADSRGNLARSGDSQVQPEKERELRQEEIAARFATPKAVAEMQDWWTESIVEPTEAVWEETEAMDVCDPGIMSKRCNV